MCRLFGVLSQKPTAASNYLLDAPRSLVYQSRCDKKRKQGDGWGVSWFRGNKPHGHKRPTPIYKDFKASLTPTLSLQGRGRRVRDGLAAVSTSLIGHVRWASNPLKLPHHELIGPPHTQPFQHGKWMFAHNGTLYIPREVKAELGVLKKFVKGKNDSEVLFYWLLKTVVYPKGSWAVKIRSSFKKLDRIWKGCRHRYPIYKQPYHGLNWVLSNGHTLIAFCYATPKGFDKGKALCNPKQPYFQLQHLQTSDQCVVASEPLDAHPGWRAFRHGQLLIAERTPRRVKVKLLQVT